MMDSDFVPEKVKAGDVLPELVLSPVDRKTLALFAGASGDHHPIHIDLDYARAAGMPDVFAHGMLVMAWLGRLVTNWAPQERLRGFRGRFVGITHLGNIVRCSGKVVELFEKDGEPMARVELLAANQFGQNKIVGDAIVSLVPETKGAN